MNGHFTAFAWTLVGALLLGSFAFGWAIDSKHDQKHEDLRREMAASVLRIEDRLNELFRGR